MTICYGSGGIEKIELKKKTAVFFLEDLTNIGGYWTNKVPVHFSGLNLRGGEW